MRKSAGLCAVIVSYCPGDFYSQLQPLDGKVRDAGLEASRSKQRPTLSSYTAEKRNRLDAHKHDDAVATAEESPRPQLPGRCKLPFA